LERLQGQTVRGFGVEAVEGFQAEFLDQAHAISSGN